MKYVFIPSGTEVNSGINIDKRERFFNILEGVLNVTSLKGAEIIEIAGWWYDKVVSAKNNKDVKFLTLEDSQYTRLNDMLFNFNGFNGLGAVETLKAFQNAVDKISDEVEPGKSE
jgi:hypothetical protein